MFDLPEPCIVKIRFEKEGNKTEQSENDFSCPRPSAFEQSLPCCPPTQVVVTDSRVLGSFASKF